MPDFFREKKSSMLSSVAEVEDMIESLINPSYDSMYHFDCLDGPSNIDFSSLLFDSTNLDVTTNQAPIESTKKEGDQSNRNKSYTSEEKRRANRDSARRSRQQAKVRIASKEAQKIFLEEMRDSIIAQNRMLRRQIVYASNRCVQ